ncbi:MAG: flap endonuclease, partial [Aeromicrobium sp.]
AAADPESPHKPTLRENLLSSADYLAAAVKVVTVRPDACELGDYKAAPLTDEQRAALEKFGEHWGLGGVTGRLIKALG